MCIPKKLGLNEQFNNLLNFTYEVKLYNKLHIVFYQHVHILIFVA